MKIKEANQKNPTILRNLNYKFINSNKKKRI